MEKNYSITVNLIVFILDKQKYFESILLILVKVSISVSSNMQQSNIIHISMSHSEKKAVWNVILLHVFSATMDLSYTKINDIDHYNEMESRLSVIIFIILRFI